MRWRDWMSGGVGLALGAALATPAAAQSLPDDGPQEQIELLSGDAIKGHLVELYWHENAAQGDQYEGFVVQREDGGKLYVPKRYFSKVQEYWVLRRFYFPPPQHPIYRPKPEQPDPEITAFLLFELGQKALWAGPPTWHQSKGHYEHAVKLAETDGNDQTDPAAFQAAYLSNLKEYGLRISEKDGRWVEEKAYYDEKGWKKWRDEWLPPDEYDKRVAEEKALGKRNLEGLVDKPEEYQRVHLSMVRSFPGLYQPSKKGEWPRVRFFARFASAPEEKFPGILKYKAPEFVRVRVTADDCAHVYLEKKNEKLLTRGKAFVPGEAVEVFGRMIVAEGLVIIECDGLALR